MSVPALKISLTPPVAFEDLSYTAKIVPVDTLQSMLEDPSSGSKATQNLPGFDGADGQRATSANPDGENMVRTDGK